MKWFLTPLALGAATFANAQLVWDNTSLGAFATYRSPALSPALQLTNTNSFLFDVTNVSFAGQNMYGQDLDFFLADADGNYLEDEQTFVPATTDGALMGVAVNWVLQPGQSYYIGAAASSTNLYEDYEYPQFHLQNGLISEVNGNFTGYASTLQFSYNGSGDMSWLVVGHPEATPEPCSIASAAIITPMLFLRRRR
jgi:hypothetical protein